jgi:hypothetical protein
MEVQITAVPGRNLGPQMNELPLPLAKSTPDQIFRPVVSARNGGKLSYVCPTTCQRDSDSPQAPSLVSDIEVFSDRSQLPAREGQKELLAIVP